MGIIDKIKGVFGSEASDNYHLLKTDGKWKFEREKAQRSIRNFDNKNEAMKYATDFMTRKGGNFIIYKETGEIQEQRTYPEE